VRDEHRGDMRCISCAFFAEATATTDAPSRQTKGECRRFPPVLLKQTNVVGEHRADYISEFFPQIYEAESIWCGEWRAR
jgi:hypothetical protein